MTALQIFQVTVQKRKHVQRFWSQTGTVWVSSWLYLEKIAFHISTGCNCKSVNFDQSWQSWHSLWYRTCQKWHSSIACFWQQNIVHIRHLIYDVVQRNSVCERDELCTNNWTVRTLSSYAKDCQLCQLSTKSCIITLFHYHYGAIMLKCIFNFFNAVNSSDCCLYSTFIWANVLIVPLILKSLI